MDAQSENTRECRTRYLYRIAGPTPYIESRRASEDEMRRGGDMHGRGGTKRGATALIAVLTPPEIHPAEVRQSVHSGRCANDHPAAGTRTGTSQRGGYLAAVNGGRAHTSFTSSMSAPSGSCGTGTSAGGPESSSAPRVRRGYRQRGVSPMGPHTHFNRTEVHNTENRLQRSTRTRA